MTQLDTTSFRLKTAALYPDNTTGAISAGDLRVQMDNLTDSVPFKVTGMTTAPTAIDDGANSNGTGTFQIGDIWVDETADKAWMCVDTTPASAVWVDISYSTVSALSATGSPVNNELAVWTNATVLEGDPKLTWDGSTFNVTGNIALSGTVDGRDIAADGTKLDGISSGAISGIAFTESNVDGSSSGYVGITTITVSTGDGLKLTNPAAGEAKIEIQNNDVTNDIASRTLAATDNASYISNTGATGTVRWTIPAGLNKLAITFMKTANQPMEIIGANTVTINGNTESGGNESLVSICPTPYLSFAHLVRTDVNTYTVYSGTVEKVGTPVNNQISVWTGDGTIEGDAGLTWDGTSLVTTGELVGRRTFNQQAGTAYTLASSDNGRTVVMSNVAANTVTIPANATTAIPIGSEIRIIQADVGATSITAATGVTLNGVTAGTGAITAIYDEVRLYKTATDTWLAVGEIGTVA